MTAWQNRVCGYYDADPNVLVNNPANWRLHPKHQRQALAGAIGDIGFVDPVKIQRGSNLILDGHLRIILALETGQPTVPVLELDLDDEEAAEMLATFDPISAMADVHREKLGDIIASVRARSSEAVNEFFNNYSRRQKISSVMAGKADEDALPDLPAEAITTPGDLWQLGPHRLLCGDSTKPDQVARLMAGERSRLMPTDPPYLVDYQGGNHPQSWVNKPDVKDKHWDDYNEGDGSRLFREFIAVALAEALTDRPAIYQFHADLRRPLVYEAWRANGLLLHQIIVWVKARPVLTRSHYMWQHEPAAYGWIEGKPPALKPPANAKTVWEVNQQGESDGIHPTQKPVELIRRTIDYHTETGDLIYEPFAGSGTAIAAAEVTGRRCFALELSPAFCDVIVERWEQISGGSARLVRE